MIDDALFEEYASAIDANSDLLRAAVSSLESSLAGVSDRQWIGYIFLDDFGRTKPAFLNSTGVMYPSVECILKLLYQCT